MKKKICVVTSSRADYNHLFILLESLKKSQRFDLKVIITGMHTLTSYGNTYKEVIKDGFTDNIIIRTNQKNTDQKNILNSMSTQLNKSYSAIEKINPDIMIVLGDRYDMYPFALASHIMNKPLVHIHGGEVTVGVIDDAIRHSVSKLADIHFVANDEFKKRLVQMGERKKYIYNIGSLGIDAIKKMRFKNRKYINSILKQLIDKKYFMISLHPETLTSNNSKLVSNVLKSLDSFKDYIKIFSYPNSDTNGEIIMREIKHYTKNNQNSLITPSFGRIDYLHLLKYSEVIIGNSSSGLVEAPYLGTPTVDIGERQKGRPKSNSIFSANLSVSSIKSNIKGALNFKKNNKNVQYQGINSIHKILNVLEKIDLHDIKKKSFVDIA